MSTIEVTDKKNTQNNISIMEKLIAVMSTALLGLGAMMYHKLDTTSDKVVTMETKLDMVISGQLVIPNRTAGQPAPIEKNPFSKPGVTWLATFKQENDHEQTQKESERPFAR